MATPESTWAYREQYGSAFARTYFRPVGDCATSSIGIGTRRGDPTDAVDDAYEDALVTAFENGCNVVDTGIDYRHQRSERAVGRALSAAAVDRDSILVATKGGVVPFDRERPDDPGAFVREEYVDAGVVSRENLVRGSHALSASFIEDQFERSRENLSTDIDLYYVDRPELQLDENSKTDVYDRLEDAFEVLEEKRSAGRLRFYGVSSWEGFRVDPGSDRHLSLPEVVSRARAAARTVGNDATGLRAIQLPFSVHMADAFTVDGQTGPEGEQSALAFALEAGLCVFASATLEGGDLVSGLPDAVSEQVAGDTSVQRALNFARSAPGVTCALAGTSDPEHVRENVAAGTFEPLGARAFDAVFE